MRSPAHTSTPGGDPEECGLAVSPSVGEFREEADEVGAFFGGELLESRANTVTAIAPHGGGDGATLFGQHNAGAAGVFGVNLARDKSHHLGLLYEA